ncbi:excalibur calcium-binding domain-containing protein [Ruegeria sp.]|uniref:excalibur calcium-binding domain-containing protein n=1 Tax=Ruegeria sp. TaxID=1879320 RepID=UPI003C7CCD84
MSPLRILVMVLFLPLTIGIIATGTFLRVTDYDRDEAVIHLVALAGCDAATAIGLGPFRKGEAGYHARNDPDGDGVSCGAFINKNTRSTTARQPASAPPRQVGGAKFVRP